MFLEKRYTSQLGVLLSKIQIAGYLIRDYINALNLNIKIRYKPIYTDEFRVHTFKG